MIDNLVDLTHETRVHAGSIGQPELMGALIETSSEGKAVTVNRWTPAIDPPPFWRTALDKDGQVHRWQVCHFIAPASVIIDVGVASIEAGASLANHDGHDVRSFVIDTMTPGTERSCHFFWGMARNFRIDDKGLTGRFKRQKGGVFQEDVEILGAKQRSIDANPDLKVRSYLIDADGVRTRRVIEKALG